MINTLNALRSKIMGILFIGQNNRYYMQETDLMLFTYGFLPISPDTNLDSIKLKVQIWHGLCKIF